MVIVEIYYILLSAAVGGCIGFFANFVLVKRAEANEIKKTKSMLALEFRRIYKILLNNIGICNAIKDKNSKMRKSGITREPDEFIIFDIFQSLLVDTIVLHSLISTGSILKLPPGDVSNTQPKHLSLIHISEPTRPY